MSLSRRVLLGSALLASAVRSDPAGDLDRYFAPPPEFAGDLGPYRSPLLFDQGRKVSSPADWRRRREEILKVWHGYLGPWPALLERPRMEIGASTARDGYVQHAVNVPLDQTRRSDGYLLVPPGKGPFPAVLVVFYEPETGIGEKGENRDFARLLARRGFVTLSMGRQYAENYPQRPDAPLQPLSYLAYVAANWHTALAAHPLVDPKRIGIVGHSYGGKWALFASCLYEKFACAAWSDPGIVFDESRSNVNYWEPWYLGYEPGRTRGRGVLTAENPRTGPYARMMSEHRDLHELHALMAPRPFLVSGGSEDPPERWRALNHSIAVNRLLGHEKRVAMTNRPAHGPTPESNEVLCRFFERFLR